MFPLLGEKSTESSLQDSVLFSPRRGNILRIDNLVQSGGEVIAVSTWAFDTVGSNECTKGIILAAPWAQDELWF